jgi:hypothetical protein
MLYNLNLLFYKTLIFNIIITILFCKTLLFNIIIKIQTNLYFLYKNYTSYGYKLIKFMNFCHPNNLYLYNLKILLYVNIKIYFFQF